MDGLKAWDYVRTIFNSEKLQIAYIKAEKDTMKHIFWYFEGQKVVPQGPFGQTQLYFEPEKRPAATFFWIKSYFELESRPAGAFWAKYLISCESKVACKFSKQSPRRL